MHTLDPHGSGLDSEMTDVDVHDAAAEIPPRKRRNERGYVMTMMVIMMPVLLGFMALAVDATYFWFRGVQIQRAVDSAALSGVTRMPKFNEAVTASQEIAKRNGFVDGEDGVTVTPARIPNNNKRFKITIRDSRVGIFFGRLMKNSWTIEKTSTAEYISNIPLGSKENAIGTGYLTDTGPDVQNFWLAMSGPCAPKESGDQFLSRWDGNGVNTNRVGITNDERYSMLCDVDPETTPALNQTGVGYLRQKRDEKLATYPGLYPALVENRDYSVGKTGYDYIIDVPCYSATGTVVPPPCDGPSQGLPGDLVIQVYDPVFNPDSIQRFAQPMSNPSRTEGFSNEVDDRLKPDKYGLVRPFDLKGCYSTNVAACRVATLGTNNPAPWDVRVSTDVRVYPPDNTPLDYTDDVPLDLAGSNVVTTADKFVDASEITPGTKVRRFGTCMKWTDEWTSFAPDPADPTNPAKTIFYSVPVAAGTDFTPGTPVAGTPDVTTWNTDAGTMTSADCIAYSSKWVSISRVSATNKRGRYRMNLRTIDAVNSFGHNGFAIRAFFVAPATPEPVTYPACLRNGTPVCTNPEQTASVAGDSTMSVFASVNGVSRFYLAQLSPAKLYRNKVVVVSLWDPGEGADQLQVLRPRGVSPALETTDCLVDSATYCIQKFQWTIGRPGIAIYDISNLDVGLTGNAGEYADVCADKGQPLPTDPDLPTVLPVAGRQDSIEGCGGPTGGTDQPPEIMASRAYKGDESERKFNDRLVTVAIKIPESYGCAVGTGITNPVTGTPIACIDLEDTGVGLPEGGWWKIKYIPKVATAPATGYKKITDRTTWSVGLRGDPVHLVPNGS